MAPVNPEGWIALKFGGTSVASPQGWQTIARACRSVLAEDRRALVVCSALAGISDALESAIVLAREGKETTAEVAAIRARHVELADQLGVALPEAVDRSIEVLMECLQGIRLLREASPRTRARIMAQGELMSTRLGARWLRANGLDAAWADSRELLRSEPNDRGASAAYLSAEIPAPKADDERPTMPEAQVVVAQGFIARNHEDETVLLGRGGSDTSASLLGERLGADRIEIWTDVPGLFTANPADVADARHIARLAYDEVAAMASLGARVLHPRCVGPAARAGVPIRVRSTYHPEAEGTVVSTRGPRPGVRAVTARHGLVLITMCRPSSWQPVGFVADVSECFKRHGFSIDMMSTSPSTVAVTLDPASAPSASLDELLADLEHVSEVSVERSIASVSLVGDGVREQFDRIGDAIACLKGVGTRMVVQGAANHHLTFVVDEDASDGLVVQLHEALFDEASHPGVSDETMEDLCPPAAIPFAIAREAQA